MQPVAHYLPKRFGQMAYRDPGMCGLHCGEFWLLWIGLSRISEQKDSSLRKEPATSELVAGAFHSILDVSGNYRLGRNLVAGGCNAPNVLRLPFRLTLASLSGAPFSPDLYEHDQAYDTDTNSAATDQVPDPPMWGDQASQTSDDSTDST